MAGDIDKKIYSKMAKYVGLKTNKEVKPNSSEESEDKVTEGERDKYDIDEHYFLMGIAPARS